MTHAPWAARLAMGAAMPAPGDEPTMGEVMRRLDEVSRQMLELAREMKDDRQVNAATFVRQDVHLAQRQADQAVVADLHHDIGNVKAEIGSVKTDFDREIDTVKADRNADIAFRRQVLLAFAVGGLTELVTIALAVAGFLLQ